MSIDQTIKVIGCKEWCEDSEFRSSCRCFQFRLKTEDSINAWVSHLKSWCFREGKQWEIGKSRWIISFEWIIIYCGAHSTVLFSPHFINPGNLAPPKTYWNPYSYFDHLQWPWEKMTQDNWYDSRLPLTADPAMTMEWTRNCVILMLCLYSLQKVFYLCVVIRSHVFFFSWPWWTEAESYRHIYTGLLMRFPLTPDEPRHCQFLALRSAAVCTTWLKHFF